MLRRFLIAAAVIGAVSVGSFGMASKAEAHCGGYGGGYYGGYGLLWASLRPVLPGLYGRLSGRLSPSYGPYGYPPRYRHHPTTA
jgi:hypothetical protein